MQSSEFFDIQPVTGALGATVSGVDLGRPLPAALLDDLHKAFAHYKVLFFRNQQLTPEQHIRFARLFGEPMEDTFVQESQQFPELMELLKEAGDQGYNFGGTWHSDSSYRTEPPLGVVLYAKELPPFGGDTLWSNMEMVFASLSEQLQEVLRHLDIEHVAQGYKEKLKVIKGDYTKSFSDADVIRIETRHPAVRRHPVTGNESLFVNEAYALRFGGMTEAESQPLLEYLFRESVKAHFCCRFQWQPGSLALWDNRNTIHFAVNDYQGYRRLLHRYTIAGEKPLRAAV